ncbi:CocE/NonD family hydrolase [Romboutsia weinsteinii]|uniref:CocE/NonD family hydrolase n=1 Tax=Romboutsia weinsteinii TaxID=2020949 RepID=A0A371J551_9FIRM|nr:CocE/NonD family hydrolase [Romboutsia weinsteinii]RDY27889.1 CocE/NonD family hydrolase [Romboutsia weinsteinii]
MEKFKLYQSGIHYSNIYFKEDGVYHEKLDIYSNEFEEIAILSEDDNKYYNENYRINIYELKKKLKSYSDTFKKSYKINEKFDTEYKEVYSKLDDFTYVQRNKKFPLDIVVVDNNVVGFICVSRENCTVLIEEGYESYTPLKMWEENIPNEKLYGIRFDGTYMVKMRDGISLSTDVFLPINVEENIPTILIRTPYGKELIHSTYYKYIQRGYAVVIQDVRGRNLSEGVWDPCVHEREDGEDTLNWIASQSWSNKRVGMIGGSYLGYVQWAAASSGNPYLKALVSIVTSGSPFIDLPRRGGSLLSGVMAWAFAVSEKKFNPSLMMRDDWDEILNIRPLKNISKIALGYDIPFFNKWIDHKDHDSYWETQNWHSRKEKIKVPALIVSGWYDDDHMGTTQALDIIKDYDKNNRKAVLGPWLHGANTTRDINEVEFGNNAIRYDLDYYYLSWFDNKLKLIDNKIDKGEPVEYYTVGDNKWKTSTNWPINNTITKTLYLNSNKDAKTSLGDGRLVEECLNDGYDAFNYNPDNPAPHIIDMSENEIASPGNYVDVEKRDDILCYTTEAFKEEMTITGCVVVNFFASSSAKDTDWVVRLTDVDKEGNSTKLVDGVLCAKYRNNFTEPEFMEEGKVYKFTIKTTNISNTFKVGNKMRLSITSSAKNFIFPHSNTLNGYDSNEYITAENTIYHGKEFPSNISFEVEIDS